MGQIRLTAPFRDRLPGDVEKRVHITGLEGIPWPSNSFWSEGQLVIHRAVDESGYVTVPWLTAGGREVTLTTATVREQAEPFLLELELARGLLNQIRNQAAAWGITLSGAPAAVATPWKTSCAQFIAAATTQSANQAEAAACAVKALEAGLELQQALLAGYARDSLDSRLQEAGRLHTLFAARLPGSQTPVPDAQAFHSAFNAAVLEPVWADTEANEGDIDTEQLEENLRWCHEHRLRVCLGPLIRFDKRALPNWIYLWDDDFEALQNCVSTFAGEIVSRFQGKTHIWEVTGNTNVPGALDLNEDQQLQLVVTAIEAVRSRDKQTPLTVGFSQPWAEYIAHDKWEISPLHVADALIRAEVGIAGFSLEIPFGYEGRGMASRHLLDVNEMIDRWSQLGAPVLVRLAAPSAPGAGVAAGYRADPKEQAELLEAAVNLLLSKPVVHGVVFQQWADAPGREFPLAPRRRPGPRALRGTGPP